MRLTDAARVCVLNPMTEPGRTQRYDAARHPEVVRDHLGFQPFGHVIFNGSPVPLQLAPPYAERGSVPIAVQRPDALQNLGVPALGRPWPVTGQSDELVAIPGGSAPR